MTPPADWPAEIAGVLAWLQRDENIRRLVRDALWRHAGGHLLPTDPCVPSLCAALAESLAELARVTADRDAAQGVSNAAIELLNDCRVILGLQKPEQLTERLKEIVVLHGRWRALVDEFYANASRREHYDRDWTPDQASAATWERAAERVDDLARAALGGTEEP